MLSIKFVRQGAQTPKLATPGSAGYDLFACLEQDVIIAPGKTELIPIGIAIDTGDVGLGAFIFARSGLATKQGLAPANCVGVVDSDYRGEVFVPLHNHSAAAATITHKQRIAQLVLMPVHTPKIEVCDQLPTTDRGQGGFGSTGV